VALAPGLVTYAEIAPAGVTCTTCVTPEVQSALIRAAAIGRAQIQSLIQSDVWLIATIALVNAAIAGAFVWMLRSNRTIERDGRQQAGSRPSS